MFKFDCVLQIVSNVERKDEEGVTFYDVKTLHAFLMTEYNNQQTTMMGNQRTLVLEVWNSYH